jgi:hypothetical protein
MAENETLDLTRTPRWWPVLQSIEQRESTEQTANKARRCLCGSVRAARKQIPLDALIDAARTGSDELPSLIRGCKDGRQHAELIQRTVRVGMDKECAYVSYLWAVGERYFDLIEVRAVRPEDGLTSYEVHERRTEVQARLQSDINRIAGRLSEDSAAEIRIPPRKKQQNGPSQTQELLGFSLLNAARSCQP